MNNGSPASAGSSSRNQRVVMAGARLITACRAVLAADSAPFLAQLGLPPLEVENLPTVAKWLMAAENELELVNTHVEASQPVMEISQTSTNSAHLQALDALLDMAAQYVAGHQEVLEEHLWLSHVLTRFDNLKVEESPAVSPTGLRALKNAYMAYKARSTDVTHILQVADRNVVAGLNQGNDDLALLAVVVGRRNFLSFARRVREALSDEEVDALLTWASTCAGATLTLP
jgi:hypothetical protein